MTHGKDKGKVTLAVKALMPREEDTVNGEREVLKRGVALGLEGFKEEMGLA